MFPLLFEYVVRRIIGHKFGIMDIQGSSSDVYFLCLTQPHTESSKSPQNCRDVRVDDQASGTLHA